MSYQCPLCQAELTLQQQIWKCVNNHSFDCAKEGYVNLLPVQNKSSKDPGDNKAMMQARRSFLESGYYQSLSDAVNQCVAELSAQAELNSLLDLGCGEGYYTGRLANSQATLNINGIDISKSAIRYAAKRYRSVEFAVASAYQLPFADQQFDAILRIFAPSKLEELQRLLKTGGYLLTVVPGPRHLFELKQVIYPYPKEHELNEEPLAGFKRVNSTRVQQSLTIETKEAVQHLLQMTPYAWRLSEQQKTELMDKPLTVSLDFVIQIQQRC
ncbi:23S rRNA (guanine(745)-N(1))-methyltransferase [Paraferrimonas haliotis]|uniref:23S rRNA (Guanine(745)-N(1))-methyltransferase n=1 Tax=Paraferrimonas haliotis TaxID=2013866 RepID=A0AA37X0F3_9GAMM|nr:23S rRNA (guanine(745)-N(1))-methyltransferase [Paraferrimonas haliotis]GLS84726.1 23S rRNA (guanine(745)-N(1))-methyltransferase [Paraferrimonas haliotis]